MDDRNEKPCLDSKHHPKTGSSLSSLSSSTESEKELRREIADRNSKVENEEQYAILDGTGMQTTIMTDETKEGMDSQDVSSRDVSPSISDAFATDESTALEKKLDHLIKQRPYPFF
jgi:hypothetical protein